MRTNSRFFVMKKHLAYRQACIFFVCIIFLMQTTYKAAAQQMEKKVLPHVFDTFPKKDRINDKMRDMAVEKAACFKLPQNNADWNSYRQQLRDNIVKKTGVVMKQNLPLDMKETAALQKEGYSVKNIYFQARPGVYATANLYIPDGKGPFPGVIVMSGHSRNGKIYPNYSAVGQTLALHGYVSLNIDPWGAGERTSEQGKFEYHGAKLGASLMDIGESLMGLQVTDNIRGVDLLSSLPYVDARKIGATGASGGGNQTMWLAALDERVKAAVPVVSVGSFESYVMRHNCVCELLHDGLTFTEEDGVLALIAPRAIKICNANFDSNPTFYPSEMLKTFERAQPVFDMLGVKNNIGYQVFDLRHGYFKENREAMLGWFDLHLKHKGTGEPVREKPFEPIDENELLVFPEKRDESVMGTIAFRQIRAENLRKRLLNHAHIDVAEKRKDLYTILRVDRQEVLKQVHTYGEDGGWIKTGLETTTGKIIPVLHKMPGKGVSDYVIITNPGGKDSISADYINELGRQGSGIVVVDLWGTGENSSPVADKFDVALGSFHTLSRSALWLGKTVMGEWVHELDMTLNYLKDTHKATHITVDAAKESGLAALFLASLHEDVSALTLHGAPLSYRIDDREGIHAFNMAVHVPGILSVWGDIPLAVALTGADVRFIRPLSLSGQRIDKDQVRTYRSEVELLKKRTDKKGKLVFVD